MKKIKMISDHYKNNDGQWENGEDDFKLFI